MAALTWGVAIPFREDPNPQINRRELLQTVLDYLAEVLPEVSPILIDSNPNLPFNRAGARNACVRHAEAEGWDVVVILDADTLPPAELVLSAVQAAAEAGIHQPFHYCATIQPEAGVTPLNLTAEHLVISRSTQRLWVSPGSCYILRPDVYWSLGGQDEGFTQWGGEDSAFLAVARAFGVPVIRHTLRPSKRLSPENTAVQLHHGNADDRRRNPTYPATLRRQGIYGRLSRNPDKMRQWIAERHLPEAEAEWASKLLPPPRRR
jgi:hypothetical protein